MGYFSNGTEGMCYQEKYCDKCYWGDKACAIWFAHMEYNYEECNNDKSILNMLIPRSKDGLSNEKCKGFVDIAMLKAKELPSVEEIQAIMIKMMPTQEVGCPGMYVHFAHTEDMLEIAQAIDKLNKGEKL